MHDCMAVAIVSFHLCFGLFVGFYCFVSAVENITSKLESEKEKYSILFSLIVIELELMPFSVLNWIMLFVVMIDSMNFWHDIIHLKRNFIIIEFAFKFLRNILTFMIFNFSILIWNIWLSSMKWFINQFDISSSLWSLLVVESSSIKFVIDQCSDFGLDSETESR